MNDYLDIESLWPPSFRVKKHRSAKSVTIKPSRYHDLEILVPYRFNLKHIPSILEEHKSWIINQFKKFNHTLDKMPDSVELKAINEMLPIEYIPSEGKLRIFFRPTREIVVMGAMNNKILCKRKLASWLKNYTKAHLISLFQQVSKKTGLSYECVAVRDQATRWGSCSANKSINLNYKLIFLPLHLVNHIMIHELCHTQYLNHSKQFWLLVEKFDQNWREHRQILKNADQFIPYWV